MDAIETVYNGCRFRSRLEARWAVFFDTLKLNWDYETEGFNLSGGIRYLPDFWFPLCKESDTYGGYMAGWGFFVEIKPTCPTEIEREKLYLLSKLTGHTTMCFWGSPEDWRVTIYKGQSGGDCFIENGEFNRDHLNFCESIEESVMKIHHLPFGYEWQRLPHFYQKRLVEIGAQRFKSARFEFGEDNHYANV